MLQRRKVGASQSDVMGEIDCPRARLRLCGRRAPFLEQRGALALDLIAQRLRFGQQARKFRDFVSFVGARLIGHGAGSAGAKVHAPLAAK